MGIRTDARPQGSPEGGCADYPADLAVTGRQPYAYGADFHMTGDEKYLDLARSGTHYLLNSMRDPEGIFYSWMAGGVGQPSNARHRTSQDLSYALLGPAMYYYLTRDPGVL